MANFFATAPLANFHPFRSTTQIWVVEFLHSFLRSHFAGNQWWSHKNMVFAVRVIIFNTYQKRLCCCLLILFSYAVKPSLDIAIWKCRYTNFYLMYTGINFLHWYRCCMQTLFILKFLLMNWEDKFCLNPIESILLLRVKKASKIKKTTV